MNRFQTPNPGRFKRKPEPVRFSVPTIVFGGIAIACGSMIAGKYLGMMLYEVLKFAGIF